MAKLKPLTQLANDVKPGDLIRFKLQGNRETSAYFVEIKDGLPILVRIYPPTRNPKLMAINEVGMLRDYLSQHQGYKIIGYEILAKSK